MIALYERVKLKLSENAWIALLLLRLFVGYFFFETGWGKLHNLDTFTQRFIDWGIPMPAFNAALSAWTEAVGGLLIMAGLATRLVSIPLIVNMIVAVVTVKLKKVEGLDDFAELDEPLYALAFLVLLFVGPGKVSLDYLIARVRTSKRAAVPAAGGSSA